MAERYFTKGILYNNKFLDEETFVKLYKRTPTLDNKQALITKLKNIRSYIQNSSNNNASSQIQYTTKSIYKEVTESLNQLMHLSSPVEIQAVVGDNTGAVDSIYYSTDEIDFLTDTGIISVNKLNRQFENFISYDTAILTASGLITNHWNDLLKTITNDYVDKDQMLWLLQHRYSKLKSKKRQEIFKLLHTNQSKTYLDLIFGGESSSGWKNRAWEVYMNHITRIHPQIDIKNLDSKKNAKIFTTLQSKSVLHEEGKLNFIKALKTVAEDNTHWTTGGDLIIAGGNSRIKVNLQLKAGFRAELSYNDIGQQINTAGLVKSLNDIIEALGSKTKEQEARKLYSKLETGGWVENVNKVVAEKAEKTLEEILKELETYSTQ